MASFTMWTEKSPPLAIVFRQLRLRVLLAGTPMAQISSNSAGLLLAHAVCEEVMVIRKVPFDSSLSLLSGECLFSTFQQIRLTLKRFVCSEVMWVAGSKMPLQGPIPRTWFPGNTQKKHEKISQKGYYHYWNKLELGIMEIYISIYNGPLVNGTAFYTWLTMRRKTVTEKINVIQFTLLKHIHIWRFFPDTLTSLWISSNSHAIRAQECLWLSRG